jgi:uncharacterized protein (TIGR03085 family)
MSAKVFAKSERAAIAKLLTEIGPDAPTLCSGWTTRDLATHLVLRERRPDAALGMFAPFMANYTKAVTRGMNRLAWPKLIEQVASGPGLAVAPVEGVINVFEMFVHHEDILRAQPKWTAPRVLAESDETILWSRLQKGAKLLWRRAQVGVVLQSPFGSLTAHREVAGKSVNLTGPVSELVMASFGRKQNQTEVHGTPEAIAQYLATNLTV